MITASALTAWADVSFQVGADLIVVSRHVERGDVPSGNADDLERYGDRTAVPAKKATIIDDQQNLILIRTHDFVYVAESPGAVVEHRQADQIANARRLGERACMRCSGVNAGSLVCAQAAVDISTKIANVAAVH